MFMKRTPLLIALLLSGCGTLPQPFYGNPGPVAAKLAMPPAPVLMVPPPAGTHLADKTAGLYAHDLASELAAYDVPSVAGPIQKDNWHLQITAKSAGDMVTPVYDVIGPDGKSYGKQTGLPIPAQGWETGDPTALLNAAKADAPALSKLMTKINAEIQQSNPQSLENRTPRIFIGTVIGAPGDGDTSLPTDLARSLPSPNLELAKTAQEADFTVTGKVKTTPAPKGQVTVELDWVVRDRNNRIVGQVTQIHDLTPSDMSPYWGDVGTAAAQQAAGGIQSVVQNEILKKAKKTEAAKK
ncbi:hypothetical protein Aam_020_029 [Acidocella aminolytica 101 = DSM 11237]|uniref:Lipoprotein n=2 Tax=Acidocella TaxID=50709 RepID=A0A0D6PBX9_9PROT|nr:hypothetical protein Aam_020_029 [Acidocella aminolytica 101 = DSM 11237]GBQ39693.1 hypothetical protein AA11237_2151 [Acidocella aminolytica 101 = DSM 11237]